MAKELGTDPWTIYHWTVGRFDFNYMCFLAYIEARERANPKWKDEPPEWQG
jgi:hypothetical protein